MGTNKGTAIPSEDKDARIQISHPCVPHFQVAVTLGNEQGQKSRVNRGKAWSATGIGRASPNATMAVCVHSEATQDIFLRRLCGIRGVLASSLLVMAGLSIHIKVTTPWHYLQTFVFPLNITLPRKKGSNV